MQRQPPRPTTEIEATEIEATETETIAHLDLEVAIQVKSSVTANDIAATKDIEMKEIAGAAHLEAIVIDKPIDDGREN